MVDICDSKKDYINIITLYDLSKSQNGALYIIELVFSDHIEI